MGGMPHLFLRVSSGVLSKLWRNWVDRSLLEIYIQELVDRVFAVRQRGHCLLSSPKNKYSGIRTSKYDVK